MTEEKKNLLWLQSGGCGGCSLSLFGAESPDLFSSLDGAGINLLWHPSLSEESADEFLQILDDILSNKTKLDILCLEGSAIQGPNNTGRFHMMAGTDLAMKDWLIKLADVADYVVAVGTCAAYGGITSGGGNPADACGLQYDGEQQGGLLGASFVSKRELPVINVSGCPTHPDWVTGTLAHIATDELERSDLDGLRRPLSYTKHLVHHGCSRNEYYEYKASAEKASDKGCMMEHMGCLGTQAHADCNLRSWNGEGSCTDGGYACINCTAPEFESPGHAFTKTPKIAGIPIGLPTDMPKAWFVALSSLSKAATPKRLKENAVSDKVDIPPQIYYKKKQ